MEMTERNKDAPTQAVGAPFAWLVQSTTERNPPHGWAVYMFNGQGASDAVPVYLQSEVDRLREATLAEFAALLPGPYYMDPPDGGSVTVLEQFRRMALDAQRWREQAREFVDFTMSARDLRKRADIDAMIYARRKK